VAQILDGQWMTSDHPRLFVMVNTTHRIQTMMATQKKKEDKRCVEAAQKALC
jgi:hypothetical protein